MSEKGGDRGSEIGERGEREREGERGSVRWGREGER